MAAVIQIKRSSTQNDLPTTSDLVLGELAVILTMVSYSWRRMMVLFL